MRHLPPKSDRLLALGYLFLQVAALLLELSHLLLQRCAKVLEGDSRSSFDRTRYPESCVQKMGQAECSYGGRPPDGSCHPGDARQEPDDLRTEIGGGE